MSHGWTVKIPAPTVPPRPALLTVATLVVVLCVAPTSSAAAPSPAVPSVTGAGSAAVPLPSARRPPACTRSTVLVSSADHEADQAFPVAAAGEVDCVLVRGATGAGVRTLQRSLNVCYRASLEVDGVFGRRTAAALAVVQRSLDVAADGRYVPGTRRAMYRDGGFAWRDRDSGGYACTRRVHPTRVAMHAPPSRTRPTRAR